MQGYQRLSAHLVMLYGRPIVPGDRQISVYHCQRPWRKEVSSGASEPNLILPPRAAGELRRVLEDTARPRLEAEEIDVILDSDIGINCF